MSFARVWKEYVVGDKVGEGGVQTIEDGRNDLFLSYGVTCCTKLINKGLYYLDVIWAGLGSLEQILKLFLEVGNSRLGLRGKFGG